MCAIASPTAARRAPRGCRLPAWLAAAPALAAAAVLTGCGLSGLPSAGHSTAGQGASAPAASADPAAEMTSAVSLAGPTVPFAVKFRLQSRPMVGSPVSVVVTITPNGASPVDHLHGGFFGDQGLAVQSPHDFDAMDVPAGKPLTEEVTVTPTQPGVLNLNATLLYETGQHSQTSTFSIPLIADDSSS